MKHILRNSKFLVMVIVLLALTLAPAASAWGGWEFGIDVRFTGVITAVGSLETPWAVGGQVVAMDADTYVVEAGGPAEAGMWADVFAVRLADDSLLAKQITVRKEQVRLRGPITALPEDGSLVGAWGVANVPVMTTDDTKFMDDGNPFELDGWVEAIMTEEGGVLTAYQVIAIAAREHVEIGAEIQAFSDTSWTLSGIPVAVNTDQEDPTHTIILGTPVAGLIAHGGLDLLPDGSLKALVLKVAWGDLKASPYVGEFDGAIEQLPESGLRGDWVVDGKTIAVMPNTRIYQEKGLAVLGATVHVVGWIAPEKFIASEITVLVSPEEGGMYTRHAGLIEALPETGLVGDWMVGGKSIAVNERTVLKGITPAVGSVAVLDGVLRESDGVIVAMNLRVLSMSVEP